MGVDSHLEKWEHWLDGEYLDVAEYLGIYT